MSDKYEGLTEYTKPLNVTFVRKKNLMVDEKQIIIVYTMYIF